MNIEDITNKDVQHFLSCATPPFMEYIKNIREPLAKWIQYNGFETEGSTIHFKFKSSQNSLRFSVYGGVFLDELQLYSVRANSNDIYQYFKHIKYCNIV